MVKSELQYDIYNMLC